MAGNGKTERQTHTNTHTDDTASVFFLKTVLQTKSTQKETDNTHKAHIKKEWQQTLSTHRRCGNKHIT